MNNKTRLYLVTAIVFAAFTVIAFAVPFTHNDIFWISYIFGVIAIAAQIYSWPKAFSGAGAKSKFYGFPIARITVIYLVVQLVLSLVFMAVAAYVPTWIAAVAFVLVLCAAGVGLIGTEAAHDEVVRQEVQVKKDTSSMKSLQTQAAALASSAPEETKSALTALADAFRYSDPVSSDATASSEAKLAVRLDDLSDAVAAGKTDEVNELCKKITALLAERNMYCKNSK